MFKTKKTHDLLQMQVWVNIERGKAVICTQREYIKILPNDTIDYIYWIYST